MAQKRAGCPSLGGNRAPYRQIALGDREESTAEDRNLESQTLVSILLQKSRRAIKNLKPWLWMLSREAQ